jgi:microsomal epoxide hydrolase
MHTNMLSMNPTVLEDPKGMLSDEGLADYRETKQFRDEESAYQEIQSTKPQTLAYGLTDSPVGLAGWIVEKFQAWTDSEDTPESAIERDRLLDNLSVYWLSETINSSTRLYYETDFGTSIPTSVDVPVGHARYPAEIIKTPRVWAEELYNIQYWNEMPRGGHFPAMEVPDLFVEDLRAFFCEYR